MAKRVLRTTLAGLWAGLLTLGVGGRLAMRGVALLLRQQPHFGLEATVGILAIGTVLGTISGLVYALTFARLPANATLRGLLFGSVLFAVLALFEPPAIRVEIDAARAFLWAIVPLFWTLCLVYAVVLAHSSHTAASASPGPRTTG